MNEGRDEQSDSTPVTLALKIHQACMQFARDWRAGEGVQIESFLARLTPAERSAALRELIRQELALRRESGEAIDVDQYYRRFPDDAEVLALVFAVPETPESAPVTASAKPPPTPVGGTTERQRTGQQGDTSMPQRVDRYDILRVIGRGGYGVVYLAYDTQLKRRVALKMPLSHRFQSPADEQAFVEEAQNAAQLDHPGIVRVYDVRVAQTGPFLVQQYIAGEDLSTVLKSQRLEPQRIAQLLVDVCAALGHAHQQGYVHRDLKPGNILIHSDGKPYIADFGLAVHESAQHRRKGQVAGTWAYMSPEQLRGETHRLDGRSDIWSLGVILYEVLSGHRPFAGDSAETLCADIQERDPRPPRQIDPEIPAELERICMKCLAKRSVQRYNTAGDLAEDLRYWLESVSEQGDADAKLASTAMRPVVPIVPRGLRSFGPEDADFYLELFPGPRDRGGLPDVLRFWKTRVEETEPDATFAVGLMYGPSGCGKSSLLRAGLLPRLAGHVLPLYVEATGAETELRLAAAFRRHCPDIPIDVSLPQLFAGIREGEWKQDGKKWLVVLDQFEQWLHTNGADDHSALAHALRQCDGGNLQCLCLLRDDFWVAITRFMQGLEIELIEGHNTSMVDLFDPLHARHVLAQFGAAYGRLPNATNGLPAEQDRFLDKAVEGLVQEGKVVCVRLSLFAEMMKGRPWTLASLEAVGGTEGLGVTFLEETFCSRGAPPAHRLHQVAARAVLQALLPGQGIDIKGQMQYSETLLELSGYAHRPADFSALINILDHEVRLITPTEPENIEELAEAPLAREGGKFYQLTHDYLVPPLRRWLARKQRESWRGRAEARLAEHSDLWNAKPENRFLPRWWEHVDICAFVRRRYWTAAQREMMRRSAILHTVRGALLLVVLAAAGWIGWEGLGALRARALTDELLSADIRQIPSIAIKMSSQRRWVAPQLRAVQRELQSRLTAPGSQQARKEDARKLLHVSLALAQTDPNQLTYLRGRLLDGEPTQMSVFSVMLQPYKSVLTEDLWHVVEQGRVAKDGRLLRAASVLAAFAPEDTERWERVSAQVVDHLVAVPTTHLPYWMDLLQPVRRPLLPSLLNVHRDEKRSAAERRLATELLAFYAADDPEVLCQAIQFASDAEFEVFFGLLSPHATRAAILLEASLKEEASRQWNDPTADPAWTVPTRSTILAIEAAEGLIAERFALCHSMPLEQFLVVAEQLRTSGYRPSRFRPYCSGATVRVAAVWVRDGLDWRVGTGSAAEIRELNVSHGAEGFQPADICGYRASGQEWAADVAFAALWLPSNVAMRLDVGVADDQWPAVANAAQSDGCETLRILSRGAAVDGRTLRSAIWTRSERLTSQYDQDGPAQFEHRCLAWLQIDIQLSNCAWPLGKDRSESERGATITESTQADRHYTAVWHRNPDRESMVLHDIAPHDQLARGEELIRQGYRPVVVVACEVGSAESPVAASVWHRPVVPEATREVVAKRKANAAVALLRLGRPTNAWTVLEQTPDRRARSMLIHRCAPLNVDPSLLAERLDQDENAGIRRALLLCLGEYVPDKLSASERDQIRERAWQTFRDEPDPGLHGAAQWLLGKLGQREEIARATESLAETEVALRARGADDRRRWYITSQGHTMVVIRGDSFLMGSLATDPDRDEDEILHAKRISRTFAISTTETTRDQHERFRREHAGAEADLVNQPEVRRLMGSGDVPIVALTWYEAAEYCNWLSAEEGISEDQWCYERNAEGKFGPGMRAKPGYLSLTGYRLPTEAEWEFACRAGSTTARYYGQNEELLAQYAWYSDNAQRKSWPVALRKPSDLGLFDMHGNVWERCHDPLNIYAETAEDLEGPLPVQENEGRVLRGGSYEEQAYGVRSADRSADPPESRSAYYGFRVARTCPESLR